MREEIIANTSCLIALEKIGRLDLLCKLYKSVFISKEVREEFGAIQLPCFVEVQVKKEKWRLFIEELNLGRGEASVIAFALENNTSCIIDDLKAKKTALKMNLKVTGTLGILLRAEKEKFIESAYLEAEKLEKKGFFVSKSLLEGIKSERKNK